MKKKNGNQNPYKKLKSIKNWLNPEGKSENKITETHPHLCSNPLCDSRFKTHRELATHQNKMHLHHRKRLPSDVKATARKGRILSSVHRKRNPKRKNTIITTPLN